MRKKYMPIPVVMLCVLFCGLIGLTTPSHAATESSVAESSITVDYVYNDQPLEDVEIEIYLIAVWQNGVYQLTGEFTDLDVDFTDLTSPSDWRDEGITVDDYIHDDNCICTDCQHTDEFGHTSFTNLTAGIYYVDMEDMAYEDGTLVSSPVLLTLPAYDDTTSSYVYNIEMDLKVAFIKEPDVPTTPTTPTTPEDPEEPEEPEEPETPEVPEIPEVPETPEIPETPTDPLTEIPDTRIPTNRRDPELPQTGTDTWLALPLALVGISLLILSFFIFRTKKVKP